MTSQHLLLAAESWAKFSLEEQLGNIGSEVSRAIRTKGDPLFQSDQKFLEGS